MRRGEFGFSACSLLCCVYAQRSRHGWIDCCAATRATKTNTHQSMKKNYDRCGGTRGKKAGGCRHRTRRCVGFEGAAFLGTLKLQVTGDVTAFAADPTTDLLLLHTYYMHYGGLRELQRTESHPDRSSKARRSVSSPVSVVASGGSCSSAATARYT